ncbi:MAG: thiol reductant ABC exporter subunit CydC [Methylophaga sp.]|nr:thiol reductant ABC exporter subunit CydC [Methylophaga sp.]
MIEQLKLIGRLLLLFRPYWGWMALGILLSIITIIANVGLLALAGWFITMMGIAGAAGILTVNYFTPAAVIRGFAIVRTAGRYAERVITHEATFRLLAGLRLWLYQHLEPLAPAILQNYHSGDLLSRLRSDIDYLQNFYLRIVSPVIVALIAVVLFSLFLARYDTKLLIVELVLLTIAGIFIPLIVNRLAKRSGERMVHTKAELRTSVVDSMQGMGELLIYGAADRQTEKILQLSHKLVKDQQQQAALTGFSQGSVGLCANLAMWMMLIITIPLVNSQQLAAENIPMLALFALASFEAIAPLPLAFQILPETLAAAKRIFEIVDTQPMVIEPKQPSPQARDSDIEFKNVSFRYPNMETDVIQNLSFKLVQGGKLAIVGQSGAGKTSIVHLLLKFWPITTGRITLGGHALEQYHSDDCRQHFSVVSQHTILFNSTIKRNLLLANADASDDEIEQACRAAQIHEFISSQPDGYETWVGEAGLKLSGGQSQRIAVARALLKNAPILILDEPGEGLDTTTEKKMLDAIINYSPNTSILLITHKQAGLDTMDEIITLAN